MHDDPLIQKQIHKRLTLNVLIQGFAVYAASTAHRLVRDELETVRPGITRRIDRLVPTLDLSMHQGELFLLVGPSRRFWRRIRKPSHPFFGHTLLTRHGWDLQVQARRRLRKTMWRTGVPPWLLTVWVAAYWRLIGTVLAERRHHRRLADVARLATHRVWGIDADRLKAGYALDCKVGQPLPARTWQGRFFSNNAAGWSVVTRFYDGQLGVHAKAWSWHLIVHELVKGVAELVCLHGLNRLDDEDYAAVIDRTDHIENELWMLQTGPELVRRLMELVEPDPPPAIYLMEIAKLEPDRLERLMLAVIETPDYARTLLAELVAKHTAPLDDTVGLG
ncbi:MAG: hypothetical protein AAF750_02020 [Planctomycetota bacterium]